MDRLTRWLGQLRIPRVECDADTLQLHLTAFVDTFVVESSRVRVHHLLRREGWNRTSQTIEKRLDPRLSHCDDDQSRPRAWRPQFVQDGVYIVGKQTGLHMTLLQASSLSAKTCSDALFSIVPGRLAVLLDHEWGVWYCATPRLR